MKISEFDFQYPKSLVATSGLKKRSDAKLLVYNRAAKQIEDSHFHQLSSFLKKGDMLVVNKSWVIPARFFATRKTGGELEGLYLGSSDAGSRVWLKGKARDGESIQLRGGGSVKVLERESKTALLEIQESDFLPYLQQHGAVALPPYIRSVRADMGIAEENSDDWLDYQSFFAELGGLVSVAAPTASLHFDEELVQSLADSGIELVEISLGVGEGTFAPFEVENLEDHKMHSEKCQISQSTYDRILQAKADSRRVVAVGTTVLRTLESVFRLENFSENFETRLFVYPPFNFKCVDALITNFHQSQSSLLLLVASFMEPDCSDVSEWRKAYEHAIANQYRLFSYGDGMLVV